LQKLPWGHPIVSINTRSPTTNVLMDLKAISIIVLHIFDITLIILYNIIEMGRGD